MPTLLFAAALLIISIAPAHAYIDPGTGSLIAQILLGGAAGVFGFLNLYWQQVKDFFAKFRSKEASSKE